MSRLLMPKRLLAVVFVFVVASFFILSRFALDKTTLDEFRVSTGWRMTRSFGSHEGYRHLFFGHPRSIELIDEFLQLSQKRGISIVVAAPQSTLHSLSAMPSDLAGAQMLSLVSSDDLSRSAADVLRYFPKARIVVLSEVIGMEELDKLFEVKNVADVWIISPSRTVEIRQQFELLGEEMPKRGKRLVVKASGLVLSQGVQGKGFKGQALCSVFNSSDAPICRAVFRHLLDCLLRFQRGEPNSRRCRWLYGRTLDRASPT